VFGPEEQYLQHLGFYAALAELPQRNETGSANPMHNFPGHLAGIAAYRDKALAVLMFRSSWIDYDYHDLPAQKQILADAFAGIKDPSDRGVGLTGGDQRDGHPRRSAPPGMPPGGCPPRRR
jgi:hypothetical protein